MKTLTYSGGHNWNYLGKYYGIDPTVLAAYNGQAFADLNAPVAAKFVLRVPNAAELTAFYPQYRKIFMTAHESFGLALRPPTLTNAPQVLKTPLLQGSGNMVIVNAARMRRFSHTGDNYGVFARLRTPNPRHEGRFLGPDVNALSFTEGWWKCNVLVGDVLYAAGYDWPMSEFKRYLQPNGLLRYMSVPNTYAKPVWVAQRFSGGGRPQQNVPYVPPTARDLSDVQPGDVMLLHGGDDDTGHAAIVTSTVRVDEKGRVLVRVVDIYGEDWYDVTEHKVKAIVRPTKKLGYMPAESVGGDPNSTKLLEGDEQIDDTPVGEPLYAAWLDP
ncbi:MAG: hypothetical protein IT381_31980 [Deltaproteobacteria bacterium]|nr:hypothetical protein [Deltaproteobacteria bacterium]